MAAATHTIPIEVDSDRRTVVETMGAMQRGALTSAGYAAFQAACARLDPAGEGIDLDPSLNSLFEASMLGEPRSISQAALDIAFCVVVGLIFGYGLLVVTGAAYTGRPDLLDRLRWQEIEFRGTA